MAHQMPMETQQQLRKLPGNNVRMCELRAACFVPRSLSDASARLLLGSLIPPSFRSHFFTASAALCGLRRAVSAMGHRLVRHVHVPRVLGAPPWARRAHFLRPFSHDGLVDRQADPADAGKSTLPGVFLALLIGSNLLVRFGLRFVVSYSLSYKLFHEQQGGNDSFRDAFAAAGVPTTLSISQKYNTPQAEAYRQLLSARVEGRAASSSLPKWDPTSVPQSSAQSFASGGSADTRGVEALKGESEQDYVARQVRLRDEARARMQAKFGANGMQGIGSSGETSAPASAGGVADLSSAFGYFTSTVTAVASTAASTAASLVKDKDIGSKVSSGWSYVQSTITDPSLTSNVKSTATSAASTGWSALSTGASAVWKTAQTVVDSTVNGSASAGGHGSDGQFPTFNSGLAPTGKYAGIGSSNNASRDHDNDSWLDLQLGDGASRSSSMPKASSFSGSASTAATTTSSYASPHASSFSSSASAAFSSSSASSGVAPSSSGSSSSSSTPAAPVAPAPAAAPVEKKKDVDFFGEFGF